MRVVLDMNLSPAWVDFLAKRGTDAVHWADVGDRRAPDIEIMQWAAKNGHVVVSHDLGFSILLAVTGASGPSVIQLRTQDVLPDSAIGEKVVSVLEAYEGALRDGAIVTIDLIASRIRLLPIRSKQSY